MIGVAVLGLGRIGPHHAEVVMKPRGAELPISADHGRQVIQVMEAMERSSATGREVRFPAEKAQ